MGPKRAAAVKDEEVAVDQEVDTEKEVKQTKKAKTGKTFTFHPIVDSFRCDTH